MPRGSRRHKRQRPTNTAAREEVIVTVREWKYDDTGKSCNTSGTSRLLDNDDDDDDTDHTPASSILPPPISSLRDLPPFIHDKLQRVGIQTPTEIQKYVWPILLMQAEKEEHAAVVTTTTNHHHHHHLICIAPTASGKTFAYGSIMGNHNTTTMLILTPTRELTQQVQLNLQSLHQGGTTTTTTTTTADETGCDSPVVVVLAIYGGRADRTEQRNQLQTSLQQQKSSSQSTIIVATPGRLWDLLSSQEEYNADDNDTTTTTTTTTTTATTPTANIAMLLNHTIGTIVLDEADRLALDASLREQVNGIILKITTTTTTTNNNLSTKPTSPRMILASATWPDRISPVWKTWIDRLNHSCNTNNSKARTYSIVVQSSQQQQQQQHQQQGQQHHQQLPSPMTTATNNNTRSSSLVAANIPSTIRQVIHVCSEHKRRKKLIKTIQAEQQSQSQPHGGTSTGLVFFATIHELKATERFLRQNHIACTEWHGQLSQHERDGILLLQQQNQQQQQHSVILATDIAARGIHNDTISYVIHYDFSSNLEQYIHRCGRIRNSKQGTSYGFFLRKFKALAKDLVQLLQDSQQIVDPNLLAMALVVKKEKPPDAAPTNSKKRPKRDLAATERTKVDCLDQDDDDSFPDLSGQRVILKRAENVSEPSSSDDETDAE